jgi:hypothetical protein
MIGEGNPTNRGIGFLIIEFELEGMSAYLAFFGGSLQQQLNQLEASYQEDIASAMTEYEVDNADNYYSERFQEAEREFPQLLLLSFITTWYSFVEQRLLDLCDEFQLKTSIKSKDKGIVLARNLLKEAEGYTFDARHWQKLTDINKLRNRIVHKGKRFSGSYDKPKGHVISYVIRNEWTFYVPMEKQLHNYLEKNNLILHAGTSVEIMPTLDYCRSLITFGRELFSKLYADLV